MDEPKPLASIDAFPPLKVVADPRRLAILRQLMHAPATLTLLGNTFQAHPAQIRHHLKQLERAGLVQLVETRVVGGYVEKYYQASARAYRINLNILPQDSSIPGDPVVILGSDDMALNQLAAHFQQQATGPQLHILPVGSLDGLVALRQGACQLSGCHLLDPLSQEYNLPYIQHLFPDREMAVFTLANREQGLILPPGNPRQLRGLEDLAQAGLRLINRKKGSGTRLWLDEHLARLGIPAADIAGYDIEVSTHAQVARAVAEKRADAGLGVLAAARALDLGFLPLFEERFDLVLPREETANPAVLPILEVLQSDTFRRTIRSLGGYATEKTGQEVALR